MIIGEIILKDVVVEWVIFFLFKEYVILLDIVRKGYWGECDDKWEGLYLKVKVFVKYMKNFIEIFFN